MPTCPTPRDTAPRLDAALRRKGYLPGPPPQLTEADLAADRRAYGTYILACGHRRTRFVPYHRGRHYAGLLVCRVAGCPCCEEA
jgi:hypothetical protein